MALTKNIRCLDAVALISSYLDGGLGWRERRRLEHHLAGCPACTAYLDQLRVTVASTSHPKTCRPTCSTACSTSSRNSIGIRTNAPSRRSMRPRHR